MKEDVLDQPGSLFLDFIRGSVFWRYRLKNRELDKWEAFYICNNVCDVNNNKTRILATYDPNFIRETYPHRNSLKKKPK